MLERDAQARLLLSLVILTAVSAFAAWRLANGSDPPAAPAAIPGSAAELAMHLRDRLPGARIVSTRTDGTIDRSFFLTVEDTDEEALRKLTRAVDRVGQWRGVVLCEWLVNGENTPTCARRLRSLAISNSWHASSKHLGADTIVSRGRAA